MKGNPKSSLALLCAVFFLIFFQLLSDFVETIYAFGLLQTSLTGEIASVVLLFAPVALLCLRARGVRKPCWRCWGASCSSPGLPRCG